VHGSMANRQASWMRHCPEVVSMNLLQGYFVRGGRAELSSNANVLLYSNVFNLTAQLSWTRSFNCRSYRWKLCSALFMGLCRWTEAISHLVMLFLTSVGSWVDSSMFSTAQWCLHVFAQGIRGLPCQFNDKHVVEISLDGYLVFTWSA